MPAVIFEFPEGFPRRRGEEEEYKSLDRDAVFVVRETPARKARERFKFVLEHREELNLHFALNPVEYVVPVEPPEDPQGLLRILEDLGIWFCRNFHRGYSYKPGAEFSQCRCGRKYAVPWAYPTHPVIKPIFPRLHDPHVYVNEEPFPMPSVPTRQAPALHGTQGVV